MVSGRGLGEGGPTVSHFPADWQQPSLPPAESVGKQCTEFMWTLFLSPCAIGCLWRNSTDINRQTDRRQRARGGKTTPCLPWLFFFFFLFSYQGNNGDILSPCLSSGGGREVLKTESSECFLLLGPWVRLSAANVWAALNKHESKSAFCAFVKRHWLPVLSQLGVINKGGWGRRSQVPGIIWANNRKLLCQRIVGQDTV